MDKKIIIDMSYVREVVHSGVAKYGYRLIEYIIKHGKEDNYILLVNVVAEDYFFSHYPQFEIHVIGKSWMNQIRVLRVFLFMLDFKRVIKKIDFDIMFCPFANEINCLKTHQKKLVVIHDLQLRIDLKKGFSYYIHKFVEDSHMKNAESIITISEFSKRQILSFYPHLGHKIVNFSNSVSMSNESNDVEAMNLDYKYILYVGRLSEMKNTLTLLKAFNILSKTHKKLKLVLVTTIWDYWNNTLLYFVKNNGLEEMVILVKSCSEKELCMWYKGASVFVFPSLREGFGSPPIEAAYMGIPVVCSKADSLEEVTLGLLNYYEPATDERALANIVDYVLNSPPSKKELENIKTQFIKHYSIDVFGKKICNYIQKYTEVVSLPNDI